MPPPRSLELNPNSEEACVLACVFGVARETKTDLTFSEHEWVNIWIPLLDQYAARNTDSIMTFEITEEQSLFVERLLFAALDRQRAGLVAFFEPDEVDTAEFLLYELQCFNSNIQPNYPWFTGHCE